MDQTETGISTKHVVILVLVGVLIHVVLFDYYGVRALFDSIDYLSEADYLIMHHELKEVTRIFYTLPIFFIATSRWLFSGQVAPFLILQCLISAISMVALYLASARLFKNSLAGFFSCLLFLCWSDNIHWNTAIMTESLACSFMLFIVYRLTRFEGTKADYLWLTMLLIASLLTRPTGLIALIGVMAFLAGYHKGTLASKPVLAVSVVTSVLVVGWLGAEFVFSHWDFADQYVKGNIVTYADIAEQNFGDGLRITSDVATWNEQQAPSLKKIASFIMNNPLYFAKLAAFKIAYLISFVRPYYSPVHNVYSAAWMSLVYFLFFLGWRNSGGNAIKLFVATVIVANCLLVGASTVDWDNRFYIPMEPGIVLLAGGGAVYAWNVVRQKWIG